MTPSERTDEVADGLSYTARDVIYRDGALNAFDVQRAADALLRQGIKPSVAAVRDQLGGGSPNTLTPLLSKYWENLGQRLGAEPESLERVPESLARVTELLWRRALEEARERLKVLQEPDASVNHLLPLQEQVMKLSVALAEARAGEGEQLTYLAALSRERNGLRAERGNLLALLNSTQSLLEQQSARITMLQRVRTKTLFVPAKASARVQAAKLVRRSADRVSVGQARPKRKGSKARKLKRGR